ncbi:hypothetical protein [Virgibacillus siamensis]|uniref:hypothetical protein n=1 Tax=Virgibacillus siamensis TaxID=480071 RepID=UPI000985E43E|nr:hypothetical protein [Virgibacillus siamensis]
MRVFIIFAFAITAITVLVKWRYRIINTLLAISFLRKLAIMITMNMPEFRNKVVPNLLGRSSE